MNVAEQCRRQFHPCACPTAIADASSTEVEEGDRTLVNEIGVISGIRKIVLPKNERGYPGFSPVTSFGSAEKRAESERWIEITPPSRAVALALTGSGIATEETPSAAQAPSIQGDLQEIGMFLNCEDFQRTYRALSERGVKFLAPPAKMPLGLFSIFEDIEGRRYLLGQW